MFNLFLLTTADKRTEGKENWSLFLCLHQIIDESALTWKIGSNHCLPDMFLAEAAPDLDMIVHAGKRQEHLEEDLWF